MRVLLIIATLVSTAFAVQQVELTNSSDVNLGYVGSATDAKSLQENGSFSMKYNGVATNTRKYKLRYQVDMLEKQCMDYVNDYYPYMHGYPLFIYLGQGMIVPYGYYGRGGYYRNFYRYNSSSQRCVRWEDVLIRREKTLKVIIDKEVLETVFIMDPDFTINIEFTSGGVDKIGYKVNLKSLHVKRKNARKLKLSL